MRFLRDDLFFFEEHALKNCVLGLEHSFPRPREGLSSKTRSLVLDFFESLTSNAGSSTPFLISNTQPIYAQDTCFSVRMTDRVTVI